VGVTDQITTIISFKKLVLAIFSYNLRYACFGARELVRKQEKGKVKILNHNIDPS